MIVGGCRNPEYEIPVSEKEHFSVTLDNIAAPISCVSLGRVLAAVSDQLVRSLINRVRRTRILRNLILVSRFDA